MGLLILFEGTCEAVRWLDCNLAGVVCTCSVPLTAVTWRRSDGTGSHVPLPSGLLRPVWLCSDTIISGTVGERNGVYAIVISDS